ncbi:hypothetical protein DRO61_03730 [Candidatus Bathyarchaeota archaeon]|jgi:molybdenum cofactor synthesis domain-containing protein|nr:MAG: hypothetical protein DRO61_03730 [Candidatus Bathyarchaeota archaeon]
MIKRFSYITEKEAFKRITKIFSLHVLKLETIPITEAYGRILSENLVSQTNLPQRDLSHFDGYAIKAVDTKDGSVQNPIYFTVIDKLYPGQIPRCKVQHGEAVYITTGSSLPKGTNSIVAVEATKIVNNNQIEVRSNVNPYEHVIRRGSDIEKGETLLRKGQKIRVQDLNLLATLRIGKINVVQKPIVAIICVGDELTDNIDEIGVEKIVNSHRYTVSAMIQELGGKPVYLGISPDKVTKIKKKVEEGLSRADIVLLIGGSSMGNKDITLEAVDSIGKPGIIIHGLKRKPGRVSGFAVVKNKPVIILPGLSHSLIVGFYTFVFPFLLFMTGLSWANRQLIFKAKIIKQISFTSFAPFEHVTFVNAKRTQKGYLADPCIGGSSSIGTLVRANAFIITSAGKRIVKAGEEVEVHLLPGFFSLNDIFTTKTQFERST